MNINTTIAINNAIITASAAAVASAAAAKHQDNDDTPDSFAGLFIALCVIVGLAALMFAIMLLIV